jgi:hypothetical protein
LLLCCDNRFHSHEDLPVQLRKSCALLYGKSSCKVDVAKLCWEWTSDAAMVMAGSAMRKVDKHKASMKQQSGLGIEVSFSGDKVESKENGDIL